MGKGIYSEVWNQETQAVSLDVQCGLMKKKLAVGMSARHYKINNRKHNLLNAPFIKHVTFLSIWFP